MILANIQLTGACIEFVSVILAIFKLLVHIEFVSVILAIFKHWCLH